MSEIPFASFHLLLERRKRKRGRVEEIADG
jgi:hypothetical protein